MKLSIIFILLVLFSGYLLYRYPSPPKFPISTFPHGILIAHAAGEISGHPYTNSKEAIAQSLSKGYQFVELDLRLSQDKYIVAVHDWKQFHTMTGHTGEQTIPLEEFEKRKIYSHYTPVTYKDINTLFSQGDVFLVTDKIEQFDIVNEQLRIPANSLMVEVFSYKSYVKALRKGIKYPMLCFWTAESLKEHKLLFRTGRIRMITIPEDLIQSAEAEIEELYKSGVIVIAFSSNDAAFIKAHMGHCVHGFYSDSVTGGDIIAHDRDG